MDDQEAVRRLLAALAPVQSYRGRVDSLSEARRGSPAAKAARRTFGNLHTTFATSSMVSALDHALGWLLLLKSAAMPVAAHWALIRGVMEGAARCRWLVDPVATPDERIRRGVIAQLEDWRQRDRFERALGIGVDTPRRHGEGKSGADRVQEHVARMVRSGYLKEGDDPRTVVPESMTNLVRSYGDEALWRLASAFAHASPWSGMLTQVEGSELLRRVEGSRRVRVSARLDYALYATVAAMESAQHGLDELEHHFGF